MKGLPVAVATIAEVNAPASSCPSIAMLTTPTRSLSTPAMAPKISGTDRLSPPASRPVNGMTEVVAPAAAQVRKPTMNTRAKTTASQMGGGGAHAPSARSRA